MIYHFIKIFISLLPYLSPYTRYTYNALFKLFIYLMHLVSVFAAFGGSGDGLTTEPTPSTSTGRGNLESLRAPQSLIKPARFRPSDVSSTYSAPASPSMSKPSQSGRHRIHLIILSLISTGMLTSQILDYS